MFDKKILCLGDNSITTDQLVSALAQQSRTKNHGLIADYKTVPTVPGYYHTTVIDIIPGEIAKLSEYFDTIMLVDQSPDSWTDPILFSSTKHLLRTLHEQGRDVQFQNPDHEQATPTSFFRSLVETNKSFCIYPFIQLLSRDNENTLLCSRSYTPVAKLNQVTDWSTDPVYQDIRTKMIAGETLPNHCADCYQVESSGGEGARIYETVLWATKLGLTSIDDLKTITSPVYHEVRASNKCNLMCRSCEPQDSHLIDREFRLLGITPARPALKSYPGFDRVDLESIERLYVAGGEPSVMLEVYEFLRKCIATGKTDFEFMINTNAAKFSDTFLDLCRHFPKLGFSVSLDGVGLVNDYIRWPSKFHEIVKNIHQLQDHGHHVAFIDVVSIYNVASLGELLSFQDSEFPGAPVQMQFDIFKDDIQSAYNYPNNQAAVESLAQCKKTNAYLNYSRGIKSIVDQLYDHYAGDPECDLDKLKKFAEFNLALDQSRKHKLEDYIPNLAQELSCIS